MDITKMSITELKALAYDHLANIENSQTSLKLINAELAKRQETPEPKKK